MEYGHMKEKTRWYEYGPGKECKTKEDAIEKIKRDNSKKLTEFYLEGLYKLYEGSYIEENGKAIREVIKFKYPISILK